MVTQFGWPLVPMQSSMYGEKRFVLEHPYFERKPIISKASRLSDPLGVPLGSLLVFGPQLLALTADGRRLLVWNIAEEGWQLEALINATLLLILAWHRI